MIRVRAQSIAATLLVACSLMNILEVAEGHGYIACPLPRQYRDDPPYVWTNWVSIKSDGSFDGGIGNAPNLNANIPGVSGWSVEQTRGHGICGDEMPRNAFTAKSGIYGPTNPRGTYVAGGILDIHVAITAWHGGWLEFRVCDIPDGGDPAIYETQDCLNENILKINANTPEYPAQNGEGSSRFDYLGLRESVRCPNNFNPHWPNGSCCYNGGQCSDPAQNDDRWVLPSNYGGAYEIHLDIPQDLDCEHCVLQMYYQTGNSDNNYPEAFWNCVDITIKPFGTENVQTGCSVPGAPGAPAPTNNNPTAPTTPSPTPPPVPTPPPTPPPTSAPSPCVDKWSQCGGIGYTGSTECCDEGYSCKFYNDYHSQCDPVSGYVPPPPPSPPNSGSFTNSQSSVWENYTKYSASGFFSTQTVGSSYARLVDFSNALASSIPSDTSLLAVHSSGGAAGGVVSEGQGYGLLISGSTIAAMDITDSDRGNAIDYFYKYFLGWKRMCIRSVTGNNCQSDEGYKCGDGQYPCLPHWKFDDDLDDVLGTGSATDGDEDAITGMILGLYGVKDDGNSRPNWYNEVSEWAYDTCNQFLVSNTVASSSTDRRIITLGSCWGGWDDNGQNPSYHAPAAYRLCRDFMETYDADHGSTSTEGDALVSEWNALVTTTYEVFKAVQCESTGLVTNWAKIFEQNDGSLLGTNGFSGSGTPATEYGSEAGRTVWRVALDYQLYPDEAATDAADFLSPIAAHVASKESSYMFSDLNLDSRCLITSIHSSWQWNAFMYAPTFASLVCPAEELESSRQQEVMEVAANKIVSATISDYFAGSWIAISTISFNGDYVLASQKIPHHSEAPTTSPATSSPTPSPTTSSPTTASPTTASPTTATPTPSPTTLSPSPSPTTASPTTASPTPSLSSFSTQTVGSSFDRLVDFSDALSSTIASDSSVRVVLTTSGNSGDVISEGQAYGMLIAGSTLSAMDADDVNRTDAADYFYEYFLGWKRMCTLTQFGHCQSGGFTCGGQYACLPNWKFDKDLTHTVGSGAAVDADADAMTGMILALHGVKNDGSSRPTWYDDVSDWAYNTCKQFLNFNTLESSSTDRRIVKLGSCWGGWGGDGQNPSYHSPAAYRLCRDFMETYDTDHGSSSTEGDNLVSDWNALVSTSYEVLQTVQCQSTGLVPNWARINEENDGTLSTSGSFTGSGTPQYEYGSEAARTVWRVALDYLLFPSEATTSAANFLDPVAANVISKESNGAFSNLNTDCGYSVFNSWQWNAFIYAPTFASLVNPTDGVTPSRQQEVLEVAATKVASTSIGQYYYPGSWTVLGTIALNGDYILASGKLSLLSTSPTASPATSSPTPSPTTPSPTTASPTTGSPSTSNPTPSPSPSPTTPSPTTASPTTSTPTPMPTTASPSQSNVQCNNEYAQCAGLNFNGGVPIPCCGGLVCTYSNDYYSQCLAGPPTNPTPTPPPSSPLTGGCCSYDGSTCGACGDGWCHENSQHCATCSGQTYLVGLDGCPQVTETATTPQVGSGCCSWSDTGECGECGDGWCHASSDRCLGNCNGKSYNPNGQCV